MYSKNEQKTDANTKGDLCEIRIFMWNTQGTGWYNNSGIEITVDGVDYGIIKLPYGFNIYEDEETVLIPSSEILFSWIGNFSVNYSGFKIYNTLGELIYTSPNDYLSQGLFFTYPNECSVGVKDYASALHLYPNPANDELRVTSYELRIENIEIFDVYGRKAMSDIRYPTSDYPTSEIVINTSLLPAGMYFVKIVLEQGSVTKKIIINH